MKRMFALSLLALAHAGYALHGGRQVPLGDNPTVVGFESLGDVVPSPVMRCSGVRIAARTYLSAAHCFDLQGLTSRWADLPADHVRKRHVIVWLKQGTGGADYREITVEVKKIFLHPRANNRVISKDNPDVAIFVVAQDFPDAQYAPLNQTPPQVGQAVLMTGYGIGSERWCQVGDARLDRVEPMVVRTNRRESGQAYVRVHDSGAGLFALGADGRPAELVGINSWQRTTVMNPLAALKPLSFHVRVDAVRDWIDDVLSGAAGPDFER